MDKKEAEKLDNILGKEERIAQHGITSEELRSRPVVLEYKTFDGRETFTEVTYVWTAAAEKDYSKLEQMSCLETVEYLLTRAPLKKQANGKLERPDELNQKRLGADKEMLSGDMIHTETAGDMYPKGHYNVGGKPSEDEKARPLLEYLRPAKDSKGRDVWHQKFQICLSYEI